MNERANLEQIGHAMMLAWTRIKKAQARMWGDWMTIGEGLLEGRRWAMQMAGTNRPEGKGYVMAYAEWLKRYKVDDMDKSDRAKLLQLMEERPGVEEWRATLTDYERRNLNNPTIAWRKWTAATRVKKLKSRTAGVAATEHGRAQATIEQLQARVEELEEELGAIRGEMSSAAEEEIARLAARIAELEAALDPARSPSDAEVKNALAVLKEPASHSEAEQALAAEILFGHRAEIETLKARIRELEDASGEELEDAPGEQPAPRSPALAWTGDETNGFLARGLVGGELSIAYTVTPVTFRGGEQFEVKIVADANIDFTLPVQQLADRYGGPLFAHDRKDRRRTLGPVPTAMEAKALCEADYAQQ